MLFSDFDVSNHRPAELDPLCLTMHGTGVNRDAADSDAHTSRGLQLYCIRYNREDEDDNQILNIKKMNILTFKSDVNIGIILLALLRN